MWIWRERLDWGDHGRATMNVQDTPYKSVCRKSVK